MDASRTGRWRRRLLASLAGLVIALVVAEIGLRLVLFSDSSSVARLAHRLRQPAAYSDVYRESLFWKLQYVWTRPEDRLPFPHNSPITGWTGWRIDPQTLVPVEEAQVGERRPVLLYGDSFAECVTAPAQAYQGQLERTPEGRTHALVNFGTAGFGTDQTLLMLEHTVERFATRHPLVIFSIFLDEDPERALLEFRGAPKPHFELEDGALVLHPAGEVETQAWIDAHPPRTWSYLWRLLCCRTKLLPRSWMALPGRLASDAEVRALTRAFLVRAHERLQALGIEHCVLGFHGYLLFDDPQHQQWREDFVRDTCRELGVHFLSSKPYLLAAVDGDQRRLRESLFVTSGPLAGHYNARGNRAVLEAILQALHRQWREDPSHVKAALSEPGLDPRSLQSLGLPVLGRPAKLAFHGEGPARCLREVGEANGPGSHLIGLHPEFGLPTQIEWHLEQDAHFVAELRAVHSGEGDEGQEAVRLRLLVDGITARSFDLRPGGAPLHLDQALHGPCNFALAVEPVEGYARACWARLGSPALQ